MGVPGAGVVVVVAGAGDGAADWAFAIELTNTRPRHVKKATDGREARIAAVGSTR
jgi:hypothetical protein